ncbi:MAG: OmpA family protein, partial [Deltaproteobacteria bacterium]|nr:OmpA family protein [Deltaproteobacteria bacterium]
MSPPDESGVMVYPKVQVPKGRESDPGLKRPKSAKPSRTAYAMLGGAAVLGVVLGFVVRPLVLPDAEVDTLASKLVAEQKATKLQAEKAGFFEKEATELRQSSEDMTKKLTDATAAKSALETKASELDKKAKEITAVEDRLKAAIDKSGSVTSEGDEVRLQLVDKVLFKVADDQLTDKGKLLIDKVAGALKDLPDKQVWVQGHTDDQPIVNPPPPKAPPLKKGQKPAPVVAPVGPRFASNWELSAARALTVVHYLQDVGKIEPSRLAALAFGQYRPVSKANKGANRRIEIVLYPKHQ